MRFYRDMTEVKSEVTRDLKELGVVYQSHRVQDMDVSNDPGYLTHELINYGYTLADPTSALNIRSLPKNIQRYIAAEHVERISLGRNNPGIAWRQDKEYWQQFLHKNTDGVMKFSYTYSEKMHALPSVVQRLMTDRDTRQAWLPIFSPSDNYAAIDGVRVPCSLGYHVMIRHNQLYMHYIMRSCDFIKHFEKDVVLAIMLQDYFATHLEVPLGPFTHTIFSLHAFAKDLEGVF